MHRSHYNNRRKNNKFLSIFKLPTGIYRRSKSNIALSAFGVILALIIFGFILFGVLVIAFSRDLPSTSNLQRKSGFSTTFVDRNGEVLYELYKDKNLVPAKIEKIPLSMQQAIIAIEDKDFYTHGGFSITGILRGAFRTLFFGRTQGGSTITQQLVKNSLLTTQKSLVRKIKEFVLSVEIERRYTKKQILELYLNETPFGGSYWGVGTAARGYFNKDVSELSVLESAILAGLPQSPTRYSPCTGKDTYKDRTKNVLRRMREENYITRESETALLASLQSFKIEKCNIAINAPHFVFYVRDQLLSQFGEDIFKQGVTIKTTLDWEMQKKMQEIVYDEVEKIKKLNATNGSLVAIDPEKNELLAMVGSYDYFDPGYGEYNTTTALRQPGSSVKPITYAVGLEKGYTASSIIMDTPTVFVPSGATEEYEPVNYDGKFRGPVQVRYALANSLNIPAVKMLAMIGVKPFLQKASDMGLSQFEPTEKNLKRFGLSITLGGGETRLIDITNAFAVFARGGLYKKYNTILEISDYNGKKIYSPPQVSEKRVLSKGISYIISQILSDNDARSEAFGTNSLLKIPGKTVAVKTGTTNDKRDNWAIGYTNQIALGVWVGNNDNSAMSSKIASGTTGASNIWNKAVHEILSTFDRQDGIMKLPEDEVESVEIDSFLGGLPKGGQATRNEYFLKSTIPTDVSLFYKRLKISKSDNNRFANEDEINSNNFEEKDFVVIQETDPVSADGKNRFQEGISAWMQTQDNPLYKYPSGKMEASKNPNPVSNDTLEVVINSPADKSSVNGDTVAVDVNLNFAQNIEEIKIFIDGEEKKSITGNNKHIHEEFKLPTSSYEIKVKARGAGGKEGEKTVKIGVNQSFDAPKVPVTP